MTLEHNCIIKKHKIERLPQVSHLRHFAVRTKNTENILEKLQEKVIMSKMTHLIKYKQIFYQIINENAGDVVNGTAAYVYQPDDP